MRRSVAAFTLAAALMTGAGAVLAQSIDTPPAASADDSAATTAQTQRALAAAQARLAWRLILDAAPGADPTISPAGLASVFAALGEGADSKMKSALLKTLGWEGPDVKAGLAALSAARESVAGVDPSVFVSKDLIVFAPNQAPSDLIRKGLDAAHIAYAIDDLSQIEAIKKIDAWVNETTQGAIPEILGQPLDKAELVALNALHFKAKWKTPFDPAATVEAPFTGVDKKADKVQMMRLPAALRAFRSEKGFIGVSLPFSDDRFSLVVVTSIDAPKTAKEFGEAAHWLSGEGFEPRKGDLALPRFSIQGRASLLPTLEKYGLAEGMKSPTALTAFGAGSLLSQIEQRATIDVNEEGAEAAAATAVIVGRSLDADDGLHMVVDKPFIYALRDKQTGLILVAGYVGHAPKGKGA